MPVQLTDHFTLEELVASNTARAKGIDNTPGPDELVNLYRLALVLEVVRVRVFGGRGLGLNSGFRNLELNDAVGGSRHSYHMRGCAADFDPPPGMSHDLCQHSIEASDAVFDLVLEEGTVKPESEGGSRWIHLQIPLRGQPARRLVKDATVDRLGGRITRVSSG